MQALLQFGPCGNGNGNGIVIAKWVYKNWKCFLKHQIRIWSPIPNPSTQIQIHFKCSCQTLLRLFLSVRAIVVATESQQHLTAANWPTRRPSRRGGTHTFRWGGQRCLLAELTPLQPAMPHSYLRLINDFSIDMIFTHAAKLTFVYNIFRLLLLPLPLLFCCIVGLRVRVWPCPLGTFCGCQGQLH